MDDHHFDRPTAVRLRRLIEEYGRLDRLDAGMTPQSRGQRFNDFIAALLGCWGLQRVQTHVHGAGEIDVAFSIDGMRFLLEAKWEHNPVGYGPIAKLSRRITQRLSGTRGVFLSMSGYTAGAVSDVSRGQQPDILLLDRTHLEAMLSGMMSPEALFAELLDWASYRGNVYVRFQDLIVPQSQAASPLFAPGAPRTGSSPVAIKTAPGVQAEVAVHGTQGQRSLVDGLAIGSDGLLLLTMADGIAGVEPASGDAEWIVPVPGCRRDALALADGSVLVLHGGAVLRWDNKEVQIIAGGFTGNTSLLKGSDDQLWVFDCKTQPHEPGYQADVTLTLLRTALGTEERHIISDRLPPRDAVWVTARQFFLLGTCGYRIADLDQEPVLRDGGGLYEHPHPNMRGATRFGSRQVVTARRPAEVYSIDIDTRQISFLAGLNTLGCDFATGDGTCTYLLTHHQAGPGSFIPVVVTLTYETWLQHLVGLC